MSGVSTQCLIGLRCKDFAIIAADQTYVHAGILVFGNDENKIYELPNNIVLGVNGSQGDSARFGQYIASNIELYRIKNNYCLNFDSVVHYTRQNLVESRMVLNLLMASYDDEEGGQLYCLGFPGFCMNTQYAAHGIGGWLCLSILDRYHKPTLTEQQAYQILKECVQEIDLRLFIKLKNFQVSVISGDGVKQLPVITASSP